MTHLVTLLLLFCGVVDHSALYRTSGQTQSSALSSPGKQRAVFQKVRLTTSVLGQQYCTQVVDQHNRYVKLRLSLKLQVRNVSGESVIIHKYGAAIYSVVLSRNLAQAQAKHYAYDSYSVLGEFRLPKRDFQEITPTDEFPILPPYKSYDYEYSQSTDISLTDLGDPKWRLRSGDYFLQIRIQTWSGDREKAKDLQQRWSKYGYFWYYDVKSEPMLLRIEKPNSLTTRCQ